MTGNWNFLSLKIVFIITFICMALTTRKAAAQMPNNELAIPDIGVEVVRKFYRMILNDTNAPTIEDEQAIFDIKSNLRSRLLDEQKRADGPVLCEYFKKQRHRFWPAQQPNMPLDIQISSLFSYAHNLEKDKARPNANRGRIQVLVDDIDADHKLVQSRIVIFPIIGGKISPSGIRILHVERETILDEYMAERGQLR